MFNALEFARQKLPSLSAKEVSEVIAKSKIEKIKAGEILIKEGEVSPVAVFIAKGIMRSIRTINGEEKTVLFRKESEFIGSLPSMFRDEPANETIVAVEDSIIFMMDWKGFRQLAGKNAIIGRAYSHIIEDMMLEATNRISDFASLSPEQRYLEFVKENKNLMNRVQLRHVASYIGITEQSLSRIRARLVKSGN